MTGDEDDDDDESDKHLEARDRRYSCLILANSNRQKVSFLAISKVLNFDFNE